MPFVHFCLPLNHLIKKAFNLLTTEFKHANDSAFAIVYGKGWEKHERNKENHIQTEMVQGPIVNFNLLRDDGTYIGFVEVFWLRFF